MLEPSVGCCAPLAKPHPIHFAVMSTDQPVQGVALLEVVDFSSEKSEVCYGEERLRGAYKKIDWDRSFKQKIMFPKLKLFYSKKKKGDVILLACLHGGVPIEEFHLYEEGFQSLSVDVKLPYGQVVALNVNDQITLTQSGAIMRYIGKLAGLYPVANDIYAAKIDMILEAETELFTGLSVVRHKGKQHSHHSRKHLKSKA
jgi:hypothetical protein